MTDKNKEALDEFDKHKILTMSLTSNTVNTIRAALSSPAVSEERRSKSSLAAEAARYKYLYQQLKETPRVPVIEGLDIAIEIMRRDQDFINEPAKLNFAQYTLIKAARAYAALPKMTKVDLDGMKDHRMNNSPRCRYNAAIDDIKSKYGELYAEVKTK